MDRLPPIDTSILPAELQTLARQVTERAISTLHSGEDVSPFYIVHLPQEGPDRGVMVPVVSRNQQADLDYVRKLAKERASEWVICVLEGRGLIGDDASKGLKGRVGSHPDAKPLLFVVLETEGVNFAGMAPIVPYGISKRKRTVREVNFIAADGQAFGAFTGIINRQTAH